VVAPVAQGDGALLAGLAAERGRVLGEDDLPPLGDALVGDDGDGGAAGGRGGARSGALCVGVVD
jgi:hypothetical protein